MTTWGRPARRHDRADGYDDYYADDSGRDPYGAPTAAPSRPGRGAPRRDGLVVRGLRALSGVVCGAVIVLTVVVWAAQYLGDKRDFRDRARRRCPRTSSRWSSCRPRRCSRTAGAGSPPPWAPVWSISRARC